MVDSIREARFEWDLRSALRQAPGTLVNVESEGLMKEVLPTVIRSMGHLLKRVKEQAGHSKTLDNTKKPPPPRSDQTRSTPSTSLPAI